MQDNWRPSSNKDRKLYKNPDDVKICGVCSGIAEYLGFEVWLVRVVVASLILWLNGAVIVAYFILSFVLDPKPGSHYEGRFMGRGKKKHHESVCKSESKRYKTRIKDVWMSGNSPKDCLEDAEEKFALIESKLQSLESFVTSKQFELEREFKNIPD